MTILNIKSSYIRTYIYIYIYMCIQMCVQLYTCIHKLTDSVHGYMHTYMHTYVNTHINTKLYIIKKCGHWLKVSKFSKIISLNGMFECIVAIKVCRMWQAIPGFNNTYIYKATAGTWTGGKLLKLVDCGRLFHGLINVCL